jgi:5'-nucleotidase
MRRIHLIHTNDLHSHLDAMAQVDTYVIQQRNNWAIKGEVGFLVDIGDHLDRVRLETEGTDGRVNGAILGRSGYDVVTLGNNELLTFSRQELSNIYKDTSFQVVCCNVHDPLFQPYSLYEWYGIKLAFIGVTVRFQELYQQLGWQVTDPIPSVSKLVAKLRAKGYLIILLSHLGYANDVLLAQDVPGIDVIMGGHTHHLLEKPEKIGHTTLAAAGKHGQYIGHLTLECMDTGELESVTGGAFPLHVEPSPRMMSLIGQYQVQATAELSEPVVRLKGDLLVSWDEESALPNLLADSLVKWTGATFGLVNNGQLLYSLSEGIVTKQALHATCPHPINPVVLAISGKELRLTLEESLLEDYNKQEIRGFGFRGKVLGRLAVSGMTVKYDPTQPAYEKIKTIRMGEELLADEQMYQIATISMLAHGVGYPRLRQGKVIHIYLPELLREVLASGLQSSRLRTRSHTKRFTVPASKAHEDK